MPAGVATAQSCQAPPGTAGIDQYCESIPGAGGNQGHPNGPGGGNPHPGKGVPGRARRALSDAGPDGQGVLDLAQGEAGSAKQSKEPTVSDGSTNGAASSGPGASPSNNPLSAIRSSAQSGATLSPGFAVVLVLLGLSALGATWFRYRSRGLPQQ